jgi:hypothetical protein
MAVSGKSLKARPTRTGCGALGQSPPLVAPPQADDHTAQRAADSGAWSALGRAARGRDGRPPTLAHLEWWTTRGERATTQRALDQALLECSATAWGRRVRHIWDRGYAGSGWIQAALSANVRFVVRWKKGNKLLDNWGEERKASAIGRGKRSQSYRYLRDTRSKELIKVGVVVVPVTLLDHPQPLWLVIARLGKGREPWYLLTADPISTLA